MPDITVMTPAFHNGEIVFWTASRAHHADIGMFASLRFFLLLIKENRRHPGRLNASLLEDNLARRSADPEFQVGETRSV